MPPASRYVCYALALLITSGLVAGCGAPSNDTRQGLVSGTSTFPTVAVAVMTDAPTSEPTAPPPDAPTPTTAPTHTPAPATAADASGTPAQVVYIVDGDTIDVLINGAEYRVRYILVDTPERGDFYFSEATEANRALVGGQTVHLVKDVNETDRYGRLLRYVYLADGTFVNAELVRQGYAQIATFPPDVAMEATIRAAQQEAVAAGRGLWRATEQDAPDEVVAEPEQATADIAELNRRAAEQPHLLDIYANSRANIRTGPGTSYAVDRVVEVGQRLLIIGQNVAGDWLQIDPGFWWISRDLVDGADGIAWPIVDTPPVIAEPVTEAPPSEPPGPSGDSACDPAYPDVCIPPVSVAGDLDCGDIPQYSRFRVLPPDPHGFDGRDDDGLGCESN